MQVPIGTFTFAKKYDMLLAYHMNETHDLIRKRREITNHIPLRNSGVIRGTLVLMKRLCGNKKCRCIRGQKHESWYISQSHKGLTRMIYVPRQGEARVRECIRNYRNVKNLLNEISEINLKLLSKKAL